MPGELIAQVMYLKHGEEVISTVRKAVSGVAEANRWLKVVAEHSQIIGQPVYKDGKREFKLALPGGD